MKNKSLIIPFVEVLSKVVSFLNVLLFVRILNIQDYADYSYIIAIVLWSSVVMDGGINNLIYNKSLKNKTEGINVLYTSRLFLSLIVITFLVFYFAYTSTNLIIPALIFSFVTYFSSTSALVKMLSRGLGFVKVDFISIISEPFLRFAFLSLIYVTRFYFDYSLWHILLIYLLAGFIAFFINKYFLNFKFPLKINFISAKSICINIVGTIKQSKYFLLYYLMLVGLGRIDVIFLESYSSKVNLAIFSSALNIYQVAQLFFISIITSQFIKLYSNRHLIFKVLVPLLLISIVSINVISPYIFKYFFPIDYIEGQYILNILIISILPSIISYYYVAKNNYEEKVKQNFILLGFVFFIKVTVYILLKPIDICVYSYIYLILEILLLLFFVIIKIYENITNK